MPIEDIPKHLEYIKTIHLLTRLFQLNQSEKLAQRIQEKLEKTETSSIDFRDFIREMRELCSRINDELENVQFGFIQSEKVAYLHAKELFGQEVNEKFPDAREEIKAAGNCYAHNLYTACVFHLMRAVEIAVKEMYKQMTGRKNLIYGKDKSGNPVSKPIELCDWKTLITGLNLALTKLENGKSTSLAKSRKHSFYSETIGMFSSMKDGWRNTISHGNEVNHDAKRKLFNRIEAENIINDTRRFMQRIALQIKTDTSENKS